MSKGDTKFRKQKLHSLMNTGISIQVLATTMTSHQSKRHYELNTWKLQHKRDVCHAYECYRLQLSDQIWSRFDVMVFD